MLKMSRSMSMNLRSECKNKPYSASFTSLQISESFNHFRSVSYFEAVTNTSLSGSRKSFENYSCNENQRSSRIPCNSTPCTPKKIEIEKYSTLPISNSINSCMPTRKTRSSSLSSFFRKLRPKFYRNSSDLKNPWIVIEFSPHDNDDGSFGGSDNSLELAVRSKAQHFTSLKDLYNNTSNEVCNCALSNKRKDGSFPSPKCNSFSSSTYVTDGITQKRQKDSTKCKSESSIFFHLSPRRRFENLKQLLKGLSKRNKQQASPMHSLNTGYCAFKSESCLKTYYKPSNNAFSNFSQVVKGKSAWITLHGVTVVLKKFSV
ncbi:uncharacterized protein LOC118205968 [Stegodyphus dumicola]|uniref:uncharacterized protein LOC118205968 n=1 Tax=Stegodyphus dumicola TaxID=202533 RepID=UPI0015ABB5F3|nr:uncharacterized protein LOC118205968 [Stegodyphus dumicola]XP_035234138.1 uncharacterized protein LOC118205968 [Stegodyphus dumicola]